MWQVRGVCLMWPGKTTHLAKIDLDMDQASTKVFARCRDKTFDF